MTDGNRDQRSSWDFEAATMPYVDALYNTAFRLTRNAHDAEDLVQETYFKAYRHYDKFQEGTNLKAWLFKIMKNTFINNYRKKQRIPPQSDFADLEGGLEIQVQEDPATRQIKDPAEELVERQVAESSTKLPLLAKSSARVAKIDEAEERKEKQDRLDKQVTKIISEFVEKRAAKAIEELPLDYKLAVILADLEGYSYKDIAEILEIPLGTVMSRLYRGRKRMEEAMREYSQSQGYGDPQKRRSREASEDDE